MKQTLNRIPISAFVGVLLASLALMSYSFACDPKPKCGDGVVNQSWEECDGEPGCTAQCVYEMKKVPVTTCTGEGELFVYQYDQTQPVDTEFTVNGDQVLVFARTNADVTARVNGASRSMSTVATQSFAKVLSLSTSPGDTVSFESPGNQEARRVQAYLAQNSADPVYDLSTLEVVIDAARDNDMFLPIGTYDYVFFDKYSFHNNGSDDSRRHSVEISSSSTTVVDESYTKPFPSPVEGVVVDSYDISTPDTYTLSVDTDDSVYWMYATCPVICGDGIVNQPHEECDGTDGVGPNQTCTDDCTLEELPYCGDGIVNQPHEECDGDDGVGPNEECNDDCTLEELPYCGDGNKDPGEECDDGNSDDDDACSNDCKKNECEMELIKTDSVDPVAPGDPLKYTITLTNTGTRRCTGTGVKLKEEYDPLTDFISAIPSPITGNNLWNFGVLEPGETEVVYIDTLVSEEAECESTLLNKVCVWAKEIVDWQCTTETTKVECPPICGDGIVNQPHEECDGTDGVGPNQVCEDDCTLTDLPFCGDGIVNQPHEECDGTDGVGPNEICEDDCTITELPYCGNGILDPGEQCDGTAGVGPNQVCEDDCTLTDLPFCGDGIVNQPHEECDGDDGVGPNQVCTDDCTLEDLPFCGNNILDPGEECDGDKGVGPNQVCEDDCTLTDLPFCGDGKLDPGEECDDGNNVDGDGCSATCETETPEPFCGDGKLDPGEECDDGNNVSGDGCSSVCKKEEDDDDCDGSIGNTVWHDSNANGIQDPDEKGLEDVRVKLTWFGPDDKSGTSDDEVEREETNSKGRYEFDDLCEGKYRVRVKDEDVDKYVQVYDPDDKEDNKTNVRLKGDNDHHTKADFGYRGKKVTPATGTSSLGILAALVTTIFTTGAIRKARRKRAEIA